MPEIITAPIGLAAPPLSRLSMARPTTYDGEFYFPMDALAATDFFYALDHARFRGTVSFQALHIPYTYLGYQKFDKINNQILDDYLFLDTVDAPYIAEDPEFVPRQFSFDFELHQGTAAEYDGLGRISDDGTFWSGAPTLSGNMGDTFTSTIRLGRSSESIYSFARPADGCFSPRLNNMFLAAGPIPYVYVTKRRRGYIRIIDVVDDGNGHIDPVYEQAPSSYGEYVFGPGGAGHLLFCDPASNDSYIALHPSDSLFYNQPRWPVTLHFEWCSSSGHPATVSLPMRMYLNGGNAFAGHFPIAPGPNSVSLDFLPVQSQ